MRTSSGGPEHGHDHEQPGDAGTGPPDNWLAAEIQDGIERWDPGPGGFQRVIAARRKRIQGRRRNMAVAGLAVAACVLLVFTLAPPARSSIRSVASTVVGTLVGVETPSPTVGSPEPSSSPVHTIVADTPPGPPAPPPAVGAPTVTRTPAPAKTPPPPPALASTPPPLESGANSPAPGSPSPSPSPAPSQQPICILGLICLG